MPSKVHTALQLNKCAISCRVRPKPLLIVCPEEIGLQMTSVSLDVNLCQALHAGPERPIRSADSRTPDDTLLLDDLIADGGRTMHQLTPQINCSLVADIQSDAVAQRGFKR